MRIIRRLLVSLPVIIMITASSILAGAVLRIENATVSPKFPSPNELVKITFTLKNIGDEQIPGLTSLGVDVYTSNIQGNAVAGEYLNAIQPYTNNIRALRPNETQKITAEAYLRKEGMHTALAVVIHENIATDKLQVANGNYKSKFLVTQPADLVLDDISLNHQGRLVMRMHNAGAKIPGQFYNSSEVSVKTNGGAYRIPLHKAAPSMIKLAGNSMPGVTPRYTFIWPATGPQGFTLNPQLRNKVEVVLDYNQEVHDGNRTNNGKKEHLGGKADLVVCFKKDVHSKPNRRATYRPVVKNIGYAPAPYSHLRFWIADKGWKMYRIPALAEGAEHRISRQVYWVRVKNHNFRLTADFDNKVDEMIEGNNRIDGKITVGAYGIQADWKCSDQPGMTGYN